MDKEVAVKSSEPDFYCEMTDEQEFSPTFSKTSSDEITIPDYLQDTYYWSYIASKS